MNHEQLLPARFYWWMFIAVWLGCWCVLLSITMGFREFGKCMFVRFRECRCLWKYSVVKCPDETWKVRQEEKGKGEKQGSSETRRAQRERERGRGERGIKKHWHWNHLISVIFVYYSVILCIILPVNTQGKILRFSHLIRIKWEHIMYILNLKIENCSYPVWEWVPTYSLFSGFRWSLHQIALYDFTPGNLKLSLKFEHLVWLYLSLLS